MLVMGTDPTVLMFILLATDQVKMQ
jgi:hypothetical protein